jgi:GNAT superfamily N-acetyltransferase
MSVVIQLLTDTAAVEQLTPQLVDVYRAAFCAPPWEEGEDDVRSFGDEQLPKHVSREGFRLAVAREENDVVGFAYGYTGRRGQPWTDHIVSVVSPTLAAEWLGGHFEFVELAVVPGWQGRGVGGALHDRLLADLPHERALLATWREEYPAWHLYRARGWELLEPELSETSCLLGLRLAG